MTIDQQTTDFVIEALTRVWPFDFTSTTDMETVLHECDAFVLAQSLDRAGVNGATMEWVCKVCLEHFPKIVPWLEQCWSHGVSIAKGRPARSRKLVASMYSLTRWLRIGRNLDSVRREAFLIIENNLQVQFCPRPLDEERKAKLFIEALYGGQYSDALYRVDKKTGQRVSKQLLKCLYMFARVCSPGRTWTHYCYVLPNSDEHLVEGRRVGAPCCDSFEMRVDKTYCSVHPVNFGRAWASACESRWTNVGSALRRIVLASFGSYELLFEALRNVRIWGGLDGSLEASLARAVAASQDDFSGKSKLRLLRIVDNLCCPSAAGHVLLMNVSHTVIDRLLWAIMGHNRQRATLGELVHPLSSPLGRCQQELFLALRDFSGDSDESPWFIIFAVGFDGDSRAVRLDARREITQISCGLVDVFEL